jgi:hypothetical protein
MFKIAEDSIKNMIGVGCLPRAKGRKRFLMSPRAVSLRQKASLTLLLMSNASTAIRRDIGLGTVRSRNKRRRKVRLPL